LGFDVVHYHKIPSYREGGVSRQGLPEFAYNFNGYQFWFSTQENRDIFVQDPWKYAPAWGGFCSWGIALELKPAWPWEVDFLGPPASPWEGWAIVDGVLIFNIWAGYTDRFLEDVDKNMRLAAERWKGLFRGELHAGPFNTHCIGHGTLKNWCLTKQPSPWLKSLPECAYTTVGNTTVVDGGGIVSELASFDDFSNAGYSPYQRRWIIMSVVGLPLICLVVGGFLYCVCKSRCSGDAAAASTTDDEDEDIEKERGSDTDDSPMEDPIHVEVVQPAENP
jgi:YHS domain-containing protein